MNAKQIVGLVGSLIVIVGCFLPFANLPIVGAVNYMFPPGGNVGDGVFVAGLAVLGLLGAVRGGSLLLFLGSVGGGLVFGYSAYKMSAVLSQANASAGLADALMSTAGPGAAAITVGLVLMFVAAAIPAAARRAVIPKKVPCPSCAELIQREALKCRFCGHDLAPRVAGPAAKQAAAANRDT